MVGCQHKAISSVAADDARTPGVATAGLFVVADADRVECAMSAAFAWLFTRCVGVGGGIDSDDDLCGVARQSSDDGYHHCLH